MDKVEYFGILTNKILNLTWNYSSIMVAYSASMFQLKVRAETQKYRRKKMVCKSVENCKYCNKAFDITKVASTNLT